MKTNDAWLDLAGKDVRVSDGESALIGKLIGPLYLMITPEGRMLCDPDDWPRIEPIRITREMAIAAMGCAGTA